MTDQDQVHPASHCGKQQSAVASGVASQGLLMINLFVLLPTNNCNAQN